MKKILFFFFFNSFITEVPIIYINQSIDLIWGVLCEFCEISKNTFSYRTPPVIFLQKQLLKVVSKK